MKAERVESHSKHTQDKQESSAGQRVAVMTPPPYGIEFVDQDLPQQRPLLTPSPGSASVLQRKSGATVQGASLPSLGSNNGMPLPEDVQAKMEAAFGTDFSAVHIHEGPHVQAIGALAYTQAADIHFAPGHYQPRSPYGQELLAHELTHVVQQRAGVSLKGGMGEKGDAYERHADEVANAVVAGRSAKALLDNGPRGGGGAAGGAIQRQEPGAVAQQPAADPAPTLTEGDKMRKAILEAAEKRLKEKTTIVSEANIQDIREGMVRFKLAEDIELRLPLKTPVKNFTTCIEFAGQTFGDAAKVMGKNQKDASRIAKLLPNILKIFNQETQLNAQIEAFQKAIQNFNKPIADVEARKQGFEDKKEQLEELKTGDKVKDKAIDQQIVGQNQAIRQLDVAIAIMEKEQKKFKDKVDKLKGDYAVLDAQDDALVRAAPGLTNGRPKPGEYILLGAATAQAYGVSKETKVSLAKGSFKHIAVFNSLEAAPSPKDKPDEKWEKWHTIDGGGTAAKSTEFYIRLSDLRVQFAEPDKPWASSTTALIGWIDMNTLMTDQSSATATPK